MAKNNKTKTTKHTIEFSNNTPRHLHRPRNKPAAFAACGVRTVGTTRNPGVFLEDAVALFGLTRVAATWIKLREC